MSEKPGGGSTSPSSATPALEAGAKTMCVSGSYAAPGQFVPPPVVPIVTAAYGPPGLLNTGGRNIGPMRYDFSCSSACCRSAGVKSISSDSVTACRAYAGGFVGNGCVGDVFSPGTSLCGTGRSSIGHTGWPVTRSNTYRNASLLGTATALIALPLTVMSARSGGDDKS